jgi:hypothetical protein
MANNWPVALEDNSDSDEGVTSNFVTSWVAAVAETVKVATPVTIDPLVVSVYDAVIVAVPAATAVVIPLLAPTVATAVLFEVQMTELVKTSVAPVDVVPMAVNCVV